MLNSIFILIFTAGLCFSQTNQIALEDFYYKDADGLTIRFGDNVDNIHLLSTNIPDHQPDIATAHGIYRVIGFTDTSITYQIDDIRVIIRFHGKIIDEIIFESVVYDPWNITNQPIAISKQYQTFGGFSIGESIEQLLQLFPKNDPSISIYNAKDYQTFNYFLWGQMPLHFQVVFNMNGQALSVRITNASYK